MDLTCLLLVKKYPRFSNNFFSDWNVIIIIIITNRTTEQKQIINFLVVIRTSYSTNHSWSEKYSTCNSKYPYGKFRVSLNRQTVNYYVLLIYVQPVCFQNLHNLIIQYINLGSAQYIMVYKGFTEIMHVGVVITHNWIGNHLNCYFGQYNKNNNTVINIEHMQ